MAPNSSPDEADREFDSLPARLRQMSPGDVQYATRFVELLLRAAATCRASDVHLQPTSDLLAISWRLDGMLHFLGEFPRGTATDIVTRLKVLAGLLTYRTDVPQEGRLRGLTNDLDMRISTYPTMHGERAAVRLFAAAEQLLLPESLGLNHADCRKWCELLRARSGVLIVAGAAGSGKTTTAYASLRNIQRESANSRSILTIEDPMEVAIPGLAQSQVNSAAGFDLATALRSALRQDPEVLLIGEVRDPEVAQGVFNAALTGHLVLTTMHAGSAAQAICRLAEMSIEAYLLHSGLRAVLHQRLVRRLCRCAVPIEGLVEMLGIPADHGRRPVGCSDCLGTGYAGRALVAELLQFRADTDPWLTASRPVSREVEQAAIAKGMISSWKRGIELVSAGTTSPAELLRVFREHV